jgi:signal transduction histidine kinase/CheY-like chemotaxis protein
LVGVSSDITDRKASEEAQRQLNETLEERVRARTEELERAHAAVLSEVEQRERAERKLLQAQKVEMVGQLTGGVAHDFNNLLMAVLSNLELLRKHLPRDERTLRLIDGALQGVERGTALTQRLLAFARQQDLRLEPRDLAEIIRGMSDLIERAVGDGIEIRISIPPLLPAALIEANQIELALLNLVVNGRDAMPDGGVLTISLDRVEGTIGDRRHGQFVRLSVIDTGHGMNEETLRKATDPFFSTKELGKGTGLGLSMVHGLALQLGGVLRLASEVGRGTRAELWLPTTTATPKEPTDVAEQNVEELPRLKILIVDDDALISMSTVDMLEDLGHEVLEAHSGKRALEILQDVEGVDLMITDYSMPKMNGMELATTARDLRPDLPILLATGYAELPSGPALDLPRIDKPYHQERLAAGIAVAVRSLWKRST